MRILVDRFTYQGLRYVQADTPPVIKPYAGQLQDQDEKGSLARAVAQLHWQLDSPRHFTLRLMRADRSKHIS
jgi:hypothetical protein